ncbi:MAG: tetratricopeptide repeat protein [Flavobacterium sp.]|nr:MAG: tetratricopeptide repeat protein [Flavobacterium sp.]
MFLPHFFEVIFFIFGCSTSPMKSLHCLLLVVCLNVFGQADLARGEQLFHQGELSQAAKIFRLRIQNEPANSRALEFLGDISATQKNWDSAAYYYERLKSVNPRSASAQYKYGGAMAMSASQSNKVKALTMVSDIRNAFERAIALDPKHINARWALIELNLQLPAIFGGSESKATTYANELLKISAVDGWLAKGKIAEYFERYATAEKYYRKAVETGGSRTTYQKLAELYKNKMNRPDKAKETMAAYLQKNKS